MENRLLAEQRIAEVSFRIMSGDLLQTSCQVLVNPANAFLAPSGGVCGAIYKEAGATPFQECAELLEKLETSELKIGQCVLTTKEHLSNPNVQAILHAVGPTGELPDRKELLWLTYKNALKLVSARTESENSFVAASVQGLSFDSIAFPSISTGIFQYPLKEAAEVAVKAIREFFHLNPNSTLRVVELVVLEGDAETAHAYLEAAKHL